MNHPHFQILTLALATLTTIALHAEIVRNAPPLPVLKSGGWDSLKLSWTHPEAELNSWGNPIGNGYIGAKIKGGVETDFLQLNDKTFWSAGPSSQQDPKRKYALAETPRNSPLATSPAPTRPPAACGVRCSPAPTCPSAPS